MYTIFALGLVAFILCFIITPICRTVAIRLRIVDRPDKERKFQNNAIPRLGGFAIVASYAGALWLVVHLAPASQQIHIQHRELLRTLLPAAVVVFLTGLLDDLIGLRPWQKLAGQVLGAALAVGSASHFAPGMLAITAKSPLLSHPWVSLPLSIFWLVACMNAVNLIDGLDGLASGVGLFATIATLLVGVFTGNSGLVLATMPLAGALLAFLYYNFEPASIYLGDCGSLTIGFMLGAFCLVWSHHSGVYSLAGPLMVLMLPLLDVCLAIARRYLRNVPIFKADRGHIHHMVLARGFKPRQTALLLYAVCAVAASLALVQTLAVRSLHIVVLATFLLLVWAGVKYLGYAELMAAQRAFSSRDIRRIVRDEIYLHDLTHKIAALHTDEEFWGMVVGVCNDLQFSSVEMYFHENYFRTAINEDRRDCDWTMTLPLGNRGYIRINRPNLGSPPPITIRALERVQQAFNHRERPLAPMEIQFKKAS